MAISTTWQEALDAALERRFEQLVSIRRHLHMFPEPSGEEHETSLYLYQLLDNAGIQVELGPEGRGVIAEPWPDAAGPRLAIRGDIDALRIHDAKQVEYCSQRPGLMHACGHDAHSTTVLGVMLALRDVELPWPVACRGIFQPAEETCQGARDMVAAGVLENVAGILSLHMDPTRQVGTIGIKPGPLTASCDAIHFRVVGRGGHAARPHESVDPIAAAAQLVSTIYLFVPRVTDSHDSVVVTIGQIHGGENPNVIPEAVELSGTLRTLDPKVRETTVEHIRRLVRGLAETSGTKIDFQVDVGAPAVWNDSNLTSLLGQQAMELLGAPSVQQIAKPSMGSEDFAIYLDHVPGAMMRVGCASQRAGGAPLHSPNFDLDEAAILNAAKILARTTVTWSQPDSGNHA